MQYTDDMLQNCVPETYIILLNDFTPIFSIKIKFKTSEKEADTKNTPYTYNIDKIHKYLYKH